MEVHIMFINDGKARTWYTRDGSQRSSGSYLLLAYGHADQHPNPQLYGAIRTVRMAQCGNFMMATFTLVNYPIYISGSYGSDGLPERVPTTVLQAMHALPQEIASAYWDSDHTRVREWARANARELRSIPRDCMLGILGARMRDLERHATNLGHNMHYWRDDGDDFVQAKCYDCNALQKIRLSDYEIVWRTESDCPHTRH
jgi:hypothetical protein